MNDVRTLADLEAILSAAEDERIEFKEAKTGFDSAEILKYLCALANEGGGHLVFGVTDGRPRRVVGSAAVRDLNQLKQQVLDRLHFRIEAVELTHPDGRVVVLTAPPHPRGVPRMFQGAAWMRAGESLTGMSPDRLARIMSETVSDFSATIVPGTSMNDLDASAIDAFRRRWSERPGETHIAQRSNEQLLIDAELTIDGGVTYAALILLGTHQAMGRYLGQAEVIFEFRNRPGAIEYHQRREYRRGLLLWIDDLWNQIDARNETFRVEDGPYVREIRMFNESVVREVLLNAVVHRDYTSGASVFVRQSPTILEVVSPGALPAGVTVENMLYRQVPRNRLLAEAVRRCGLVERSGQGVDRIYEINIREGKGRPDYSATDDYQVSVVLNGEVRDARFLRYVESAAVEAGVPLDLEDLLIVDLIHREQNVPPNLEPRLPNLRDRGLIELQGSGRHARWLLPPHFYEYIGEPGAYTRRLGLSRGISKGLLEQHLRLHAHRGCPLRELVTVVTRLSTTQVQVLLRELQSEGKAHVRGRTRGARWYPGPEATDA